MEATANHKRALQKRGIRPCLSILALEASAASPWRFSYLHQYWPHAVSECLDYHRNDAEGPNRPGTGASQFPLPNGCRRWQLSLSIDDQASSENPYFTRPFAHTRRRLTTRGRIRFPFGLFWNSVVSRRDADRLT